MTKAIRIAAAVLENRKGQVLLVRKRGTQAFMQPGGKMEPGETPRVALARELMEELNVSLPPAVFEPMGRISAPAANEPGWIVEAELFRADWDGEVVAAAEIDAVRWVDPRSPGDLPLAPLTRDSVLPLCCEPT